MRFMDQRDADDAIDRLDGEHFAGRELRIQVCSVPGHPFCFYLGWGGAIPTAVGIAPRLHH